MIRRLVTGLASAGLLGVLVAVPAAPALAAPADSPEVVAGRDYPGDPAAEARLVAGEERRILDVRATLEVAERTTGLPGAPFRLKTPGTATIVLVGRDSAYTMPELSRMAPRSVVEEADGSYLLTEHLYIAEGATLRIASSSKAVLKLQGGPGGFVSIVADGGSLEVEGDPGIPLEVTSWDPALQAPDTVTSDGRPYVRVYAGHARLVDARFSDLGFWSGLTGGLALTGAILPDALSATPDDAATPPETLIPGAEALGDGDPTLETLSLEEDVADGYSSALIQSVEVVGDAFGLFVTNSDRVEVRDSLFADSLVDGVVFHRDVTNSTIIGSTARGNAQDGFNLTRATSSVVFDGLVARENGRNGITLEGRPLVDGPSATGIPVVSYGDNEVRNSTSTANGRIGIEVVGGTGITVRANQVSGNPTGIVVTGGAEDVTVDGNTVERSARQGIAVRDAGSGMQVVDNRVVGGDIGIYLRDAVGRLESNRVSEVTNHGIALVGETGGSAVVGNVVSGAGPSAIDVHRTEVVAVRSNDTAGWTSTKPLDVILGRVFQPLTVLWLVIALLLVVTLGVSRRRRAPGVDPFADQRPLSSYTRGIVEREQVHELEAPERRAA